MSRKFSLLLFCSIILILTGCAKDEHGRTYYDSNGGSLKDTHMRKAGYKKKASSKKYTSRRKYRAYAYRSSKQTRKKPKIAKVYKSQKAYKNNSIQQKTIKLEKQKLAKNTVDTPADNKLQKQLPLEEGSADEGDVTVIAEDKTANKPVIAGLTEPQLKKNNQKQSALDEALKTTKPASEETDKKRANTKTQEEKPKKLTALHIGINPEQKQNGETLTQKQKGLKEGNAPFHIVKVYYATDRNLSGQSSLNKVYGSQRSSISYGHCEISIPVTHKTGEIEKPSLWRMEFNEDAKKHVVLKSVRRNSKKRFFKDIESNLKLSTGKKAFIFIHGYNVKFHEAAQRTAQIAHDIGFGGAPIFYSWPARGGHKDYSTDEINIEWSRKNIQKFLRDVVMRTDAQNIYLISHSLGARAISEALAKLAKDMPSIRKRIKEVFLAAPDIDAEVFKREIAPKLVKAAQNITIYASTDDQALKVRRSLRGKRKVGDAGENILVMNGIDTIDATGADTSLFGKSSLHGQPTILSDITSIIKYGHRPKARVSLIPVLASEGQYWAFRRNKTFVIKGTTLLENVTKEVEH